MKNLTFFLVFLFLFLNEVFYSFMKATSISSQDQFHSDLFIYLFIFWNRRVYTSICVYMYLYFQLNYVQKHCLQFLYLIFFFSCFILLVQKFRGELYHEIIIKKKKKKTEEYKLHRFYIIIQGDSTTRHTSFKEKSSLDIRNQNAIIWTEQLYRETFKSVSDRY